MHANLTPQQSVDKMIGVIAATGFTGSLIAEKLIRSGRACRLMGRSEKKLQALVHQLQTTAEHAVFDAQNATTFDALDGCQVIINCAGPFTELGEPVVREAVRRGIHYIDTTGEQAFIRLVIEKYGPLAEQQRVALIPACAFEYAIGDAACALIVEELPACSSLEIIYNVKDVHVSAGTRKSVIRVLESDCFQRIDGESVSAPLVAKMLEVSAGRSLTVHSFPAGEIFMVPLHSPVPTIQTYMATSFPHPLLNLGLTVMTGALKLGLPTLLLAMMRNDQGGPSSAQRKSTTFEILCKGRTANQEKLLRVVGADPYGLTAELAVGIALRLIDDANHRAGALSPSMVTGAGHIKEIAASVGVSWH